MKSLKLNKVQKNQLSAEQMKSLKGGDEYGCCLCSCAYEGQQGGASTNDNGNANHSSDLDSKDTNYQLIVCGMR